MVMVNGRVQWAVVVRFRLNKQVKTFSMLLVSVTLASELKTDEMLLLLLLLLVFLHSTEMISVPVWMILPPPSLITLVLTFLMVSSTVFMVETSVPGTLWMSSWMTSSQ